MNFGGNGYINLCNNFVVFKDNFLYNNVNTSFNFCNNLTSGVTMNMGGLGTVKIGNVFSFKSADIISSGINDTINLFNNIQTGIVNFCYGLTSAGTLQIGPGKIRMAQLIIMVIRGFYLFRQMLLSQFL